MADAKPITARIEVFRSGTFIPMNGQQLSFSAADLKAMADAYNYETAPAPIVVGHPKTDAPAFGWAQSFEYDATADRLFANVGQIAPAFADAVKNGTYKKVSLSFHRPDGAANPVPGTWYPKHVGFLGGAAPSVSGLKNVQFSDRSETVEISADFGERGFEDTASMFRSIRDFFIEQFGLETADKVLPSYHIEWLSEAEIEKPVRQPSFSAPPSPKPKEPTVTHSDPAFAAREADLNARAEKLKQREREIANADNASFAETLVTDGRLLAASKDKVVSIFNALSSAETAVSFSEGDAEVPVLQAIRDVLSAQPKVVSFGAADLPASGSESAVSFAADGQTVDRDQLETHNKAKAYQKSNPGTAYLDAVKAVS